LGAASTPPTGTIASKAQKARASLLGGNPNGVYEPLAGNSVSGPSRHQAPLPGGYHDREGLSATNSIVKSRGWKSKMYMPKTRWTWAFFLVTLSQCIISLALEGYVFGEFQASLDAGARGQNGQDVPSSALTIPTYLALFIFGFLYELVLVWDALRLKNTIQIIGICIYNAGMLIYASVEMTQVDDALKGLASIPDAVDPNTWHALRPWLVAAPCVIALGTVLLSYIAWKLYDEFAWSIYKHISADVRLKRRYLTYQVSHPSADTKSRATCANMI